MKSRLLHVVMLAALVLVGSRVRAQNKAKPLTNADVVAMVKAGLPQDTIISAIGSQPSNFDISAIGLLGLKKQGVSNKIIDAVLAAAKNQSATPAPQSPAPSSQTPAPPGRTIPSGTTITVRTIDAINSRTAKEGQVFHASLDQPITVGGALVAPAGADVSLKLVKVKQSGHFIGTTDLTVTIASLTINGKPVPLQVGEVVKSSSGRGKRSAIAVGGGAAVGAILGGIFGGKKGAAIGAAAGGGAGAAAQIVTKGQKVVIPSETLLTFNLAAPAAF